MPKQNKRPTKFQSDDESGDEVEVQPGRNLSKSDLRDPPPTPLKVQPSSPVRRYVVPDEDQETMQLPRSPPRYDCEAALPLLNRMGTDPLNIAELVTVLTAAGASLKGRADDSGRFELEFEFNHERKVPRRDERRRERTPSPTRSVRSTGSSPNKVGIKPGRRIGWIK